MGLTGDKLAVSRKSSYDASSGLSRVFANVTLTCNGDDAFAGAHNVVLARALGEGSWGEREIGAGGGR